jgi:hypothetical protein
MKEYEDIMFKCSVCNVAIKDRKTMVGHIITLHDGIGVMIFMSDAKQKTKKKSNK